MKRSRFTCSQIMDALKRVEAGLAVTERNGPVVSPAISSCRRL